MLHLMTEKQTLREKIIKKFRSLSYFCVLTETSYKKTLAFFLTEEGNDSEILTTLQRIFETTEVDDQHGLIRDKDRVAIRLCILTNFNSYTDFCRTYPKYDAVYLSNVINGRLSDETPKYHSLVRLLTADYDLDVMIWYRIKNVSKLEA